MGQHVMTAASADGLLGVLGDHGVDACVGGGWAVDALLREQTREHSDLDLWLPTSSRCSSRSRSAESTGSCPALVIGRGTSYCTTASIGASISTCTNRSRTGGSTTAASRMATPSLPEPSVVTG